MTNNKNNILFIPGTSEVAAKALIVWALILMFFVSTAHAQDVPGTPVNVGVSPSFGTLSASVSIEVLKFHGIEPHLTLAYSSGTQNGPLGLGWQLGGISTITRASPGRGKPSYDPGNWLCDDSGCSLREKDIFLLDGIELIPCDDLGGTHCTKIQNFSRIAYNRENDLWVVTSKEGTRTEYRPLLVTEKGTYLYSVARVVDIRSNVARYSYECDTGIDTSCYLSLINYSRHSNPSWSNQVRFYYEGRPDTVQIATGVSLIEQKQRLKTIEVRGVGSASGSVPTRAYKLTYEDQSEPGMSLLSSVQQFGRDYQLNSSGTVISGSVSNGNVLPPVEFEYTESSSVAYETVSTPVRAFGDWHGAARIGDVNGDGYDDIVLFRQRAGGDVLVSLNTTTGQWDSLHAELFEDAEIWATGFAAKGQNEFVLDAVPFVADINGDGFDDIISIRGRQIEGALSSGTGLGPVMELGALSASPRDGTIRIGDFDGDGLADIYYVPLLTNQIRIAASRVPTLGVFWDDGINKGGLSPFLDAHLMDVGDMDGNGQDDVILLQPGIQSLQVLLAGPGSLFAAVSSYPVEVDSSTDFLIAANVNGANYPGYRVDEIVTHCSTCQISQESQGAVVTPVLVSMGADLVLTDFSVAANPVGEPWLQNIAFDEVTLEPGSLFGDATEQVFDFEPLQVDGYQRLFVQPDLSALARFDFFGTQSLNTIANPFEPYLSKHGNSVSYQRSGDFNGDGKTDLVWLSGFFTVDPFGATNEFENTPVWQVMISRGDGTFDVKEIIDPPQTRPIGLNTKKILYESADQYIRVGDFNGDGISDISWFERLDAFPGEALLVAKLSVVDYSKNFLGFVDVVNDVSNWDIPWNHHRVGDFNGDGCSDWTWLDYRNFTRKFMVALSDCSGGIEKIVENSGGEFDSLSFEIPSLGGDIGEGVDAAASWVVDLNGDGLSDFFWVTNAIGGKYDVSLIHAASSQGDGTFSTSRQVIGGSSESTGAMPADPPVLVVGDFNCDGSTDVLMELGLRVGPSGSRLSRMLFSRGSGGQFDLVDTTLPVPSPGSFNYMTRAADFNGDGCDDISFRQYAFPAERFQIVTLLSHGDGTFSDEPVKVGETECFECDLISSVSVGDFNGDGRFELSHFDQERERLEVTFVGPQGAPPSHLSKVKNGFGGETEIVYQSSSAFKNTYVPVGYQEWVVSDVIQKDLRSGDSGTGRTHHDYDGGLWLTSERRFLGYRKEVITPDDGGVLLETYYRQLAGDVSKAEVIYERSQVTGDIYRFTKNDYIINQAPPYTSLQASRWSISCDPAAPTWSSPTDLIYASNCRQALLQYRYDEYGNRTHFFEYGEYCYDPSQQKDACAADNRTTVTAFFPNPVNYVVSAPAYQNVYEGIPGVTPEGNLTFGQLFSQNLFLYDGNIAFNQSPLRGDLTTAKAWDDFANDYTVTSFTYDQAGNVIEILDPMGARTRIEYHPGNDAFPIRICRGEGTPADSRVEDAMELCVQTLWDFGLGVPTDQIDEANAITTLHMDYDPLGRPVAVTDASPGGTATLSYLDFGDPSAQRVRQTLPDGSPDGLWSETSFDGLGRPYRTESETGIRTETAYIQASSRIFTQTLPYRPGPGEQPLLVTFGYDEMRRRDLVIDTNGDTQSVVFGRDFTIVIDENGHQTVTYTDGRGRAVEVQEEYEGGFLSTQYAWNPLDQLMEIQDAAAPSNRYGFVWDSLGRRRQINHPSQGNWFSSYLPNGLLESQVDPSLRTLSFTYDELGRPRTKASVSSGVTEFCYDGSTGSNCSNPTGFDYGVQFGRLTQIVHAGGEGSESFRYREDGAVTLMERCVEGVCRNIGRGYDALGRLASLEYEDGLGTEIVSYSYDEEGRLKGMTSTLMDLIEQNGITWNSRDQVKSVLYGNGTVASFEYEDETAGGNTQFQRPLLKKIHVGSPGSGTLFEETYSYELGKDRVERVSKSGKPDRLFTYDELDRLLRVSGDGAQSFAYGPTGNVECSSALPPGVDCTPATLPNYLYSDPDHVHAATSVGGDSYSYDERGNLATIVDTSGTRTFSWDEEGRLLSVSGPSGTTTFAYDGTGQRLRKTSPDGTRHLYLDRHLEVIVRPGGAVEDVRNYYAGDELVARRDSTGIYWYHKDRLGSVRLMTNDTGAPKNEYDYSAYGEMTTAIESVQNERGFTGHRHDEETGLIYMGARYYDPRIGRFISPDPLLGALANPQSLNSYAYALNAPTLYTDPFGLCAEGATCPSTDPSGVDRSTPQTPQADSYNQIKAEGGPRVIACGGVGSGGGSAYCDEEVENAPSGLTNSGNQQISGGPAGTASRQAAQEVDIPSTFGGLEGGGSGALSAEQRRTLRDFYGPSSSQRPPFLMGTGLAAQGLSGFCEKFCAEAALFVISDGIGRWALRGLGRLAEAWRAGRAIKAAEASGTVWESVRATQAVYEGTVIPRSFELVAGNNRVWVHGNATKHLAQYALSMLERGLSSDLVNLASQQQIRSLQAAIQTAAINGVPYDILVTVGGWELRFAAPRVAGKLPVLIHALPR